MKKKTESLEDTTGKILIFNTENPIITNLVSILQESGIIFYKEDMPSKALKLVQKENIDITFSDYYSGNDSTVDFLRSIKKKKPSTSRILLNRVENRSLIIQFLLKGIITSYFEEPVSIDSLLKNILHILYARKTLKSKKLLALIDSADVLPTFPKTYHEFINAIDTDQSLKEISQIIEKNVSIATRVLRIANSDFFRAGSIGSIERACIYLGLDIIKNIVFTISLASMKRMGDLSKKLLEKIIYHSVQVNQNFQKMYTTQTQKKITDQFATIGITHDIGKIIMLQTLPHRFHRIIRYLKKNPDIDFYRSEIELGFEGETHAEIGAYFLNLWNFPEPSVFTALFHHSTEEFSEPYKEILDIFTIVNELANTGEQG